MDLFYCAVSISTSLVIIPTYKEKENIEKIIKAIFDLKGDFHILIVDDNSPDGTSDIVKRLIEEDGEKLHLLERKGKLGLGTAYIAGFKWGLERNYQYLFEMDADFSHNPKDLLRLRAPCENDEADLIIGSRYIEGGGMKNWGFDRLFLSYTASLYVRLLTGMHVKDSTGGFICYHRKVLETIDLDKIEFIGYAFQIEMKYKAYCKNFRLLEIPIIFKDREEGESKMSLAIVKEAITGVIKMRRNKKHFL